MNEPVSNLENRDTYRTDILHEYFVAPERFNDFIRACQEVIPKARAEFLNVTLRYVARDELSTLSFATTDRIAAVMSFSQEMTARGRGRHVAHDRGPDRPVRGDRRQLLPALPAARPQRPVRARICERRRSSPSASATTIPGLTFRNALWDGYLSDEEEPDEPDSLDRASATPRALVRRRAQLHPRPHRRGRKGVRHFRARHLRRPAALRLALLGRGRGSRVHARGA